MSGIGGWLCWEKERIDPTVALDMSRAMGLRGRDQRGAYLKKEGWLIHNRSMSDGGAPWDRQPYTLRRGGFSYTIVLDGRIGGGGEWRGLGADLSAESDASLALEFYLAYGASFVSRLTGSFALAIWDEKRGELLLATDGEGSRPLFYGRQGEAFVFSSEIKGLLRAMPWGATVDRARLGEHWTAPVGRFGGADLYREFEVLPPSTCAVISRMGITLFSYEREGERSAPVGRAEPLEVICPEEETLERMLTEALFAFDYPQFDCLMPALLSLMEERRERRLTVEDEMLYAHRGYARERADRLGQGRGRLLCPVEPRSARVREKELKRLEKAMSRLVARADPSALRRLFGDAWQKTLAEEKNLAMRIRMEGILCQSVLWERHYPLIFK